MGEKEESFLQLDFREFEVPPMHNFYSLLLNPLLSLLRKHRTKSNIMHQSRRQREGMSVWQEALVFELGYMEHEIWEW